MICPKCKNTRGYAELTELTNIFDMAGMPGDIALNEADRNDWTHEDFVTLHCAECGAEMEEEPNIS
jgi:predicted nucleic-acid-binding Zn-ribbon protein